MNQTRLIAPLVSSSISPRLMPLLGTLSLAGGDTGTKRAVLRKLERPTARSPPRGRSLQGAPFRCEQLAVGVAARRNYETAFGEFLRWSANAGFPVVDEKNIEMCLLGFLDHLLEEGAALYKAEIAIASVADAMPELGMLASRPRLRRALRGFRKQRPPRSRAPVAKEIMAAIVNMLMNDGHSAMAFMVLIMFFSYCRPGEVRSLKRKQFLRPARTRGPLSHWSIHLAPQSDRPTASQQITKTGTMDDTVIMDRPMWMAALIAKLCKGLAPDDFVFAIDESLSVNLFRLAGQRLGIPKLCLYQLRHGGASEEMLDGSRLPEVIQARGRWRTQTSVRRYAKPAQLQRLLNSMPEAKLDYARKSFEALGQLVRHELAPWPPPG